MQLTRSEIQFLKVYQTWRESPPTFWNLLSRNLLRYLLLIIMISLLVIITPKAGIPWGGPVAIGLFLGALLRDIGIFLRTLRIWPLTVQITDWNMVTDLLNESATINE